MKVYREMASSVVLTIGDNFAEMPVDMFDRARGGITDKDGNPPTNQQVVDFLLDCSDVGFKRNGKDNKSYAFHWLF